MRPHRVGNAILGMGLALGLNQAGFTQVNPPPGPAAQPDVNNLSHQMAERVRHLGEDIASDLGQTPQGRHLLQDLQEMAQATDEFHESLHNARDPFQKRQAYTGIHQTWHHLREQLAKPGISSPAVDRAARRVDELDAQIQQGLGLRNFPQVVQAQPLPDAPAPQPQVNFVQTQRLGYSLVQRAEYLVSTIQAEAANLPDGDRYLRRAEQLSEACGAFYDSIQQNRGPQVIQQSFTTVVSIADPLGFDLRSVRCPPRVERGWQSFAATDVLIRQQLNVQTPPPVVHVVLRPAQGPSPLVAMTHQLVQQVDAFIQVFGPTAQGVPQGQFILADAQRLQAAAADFRQDVARGPRIDPNVLADEFRDVDACWQRLARRVNRIGRGRTGPNIQQVYKVGETCEQIHTVLGMPGYPPTVIGAPVAQPHGHDHDHDDRDR